MRGMSPRTLLGRIAVLGALLTLLAAGCSKPPATAEGASATEQAPAPTGEPSAAPADGKKKSKRKVDKGPKDCTACMDKLCRQPCWPGEDAEQKPGLMDCPSCMMMNCQHLCWPSKKKK